MYWLIDFETIWHIIVPHFFFFLETQFLEDVPSKRNMSYMYFSIYVPVLPNSPLSWKAKLAFTFPKAVAKLFNLSAFYVHCINSYYVHTTKEAQIRFRVWIPVLVRYDGTTIFRKVRYGYGRNICFIKIFYFFYILLCIYFSYIDKHMWI